MAQNLSVDPEDQKMAPLLGAIIADTQKLVRQELALARIEIKEELTCLKAAAINGSAGIYLAAVAGLLFAFMVADLLISVAGLPGWAGYGLAGLLIGGLGLFFVFRGREMANKVDIVPRETVENIKENVQWIKNRI